MTTVSEKNNADKESANKEHENGNALDSQNADPDVIQTTINEEDLIDGLDVVDAWDDEDQPRRRSWDRTRGRERRTSRERDRDRDQHRNHERDRDHKDRSDRDNHRSRRRSRSNERRRDVARRDPNKSSKDIEQDKIRAKKDTESKILAEKEKAIKTLLDSDTVLPPGTETEAIQNIVNKSQQQLQKEEEEEDLRKQLRRSRENRTKLRSPLRNRLGYRRSPEPRRRGSPEARRRSPISYVSPDRRRRRSPILSPEERRRRGSYDRETSAERKEASKRRLRERDTKYRRSRSRERRSRSLDRHRSRSRSRERRRRSSRSSRSPYESRRRRSLSRSPNRARRRSPFLNELVRQFQNEPLGAPAIGPPSGMPANFGPPPGIHPGPPQPGMMGPPPGLLPTPQGMMPGMMPPGGPMDPMGPPPMHMGMPPNAGGPPPPQFMNYDGCPPPGLNFDPLNRGPDFSSGPMMYGQPNHLQPPAVMPIPQQLGPPSPQPVPAPGQMQFAPVGSALQPLQLNLPTMVPGPKYSPNASYRPSRSPSADGHKSSGSKREERMRTPEPPIISDFKQNEKTSLSSLLEASVSTKDSSSQSSSSRGFKPEIIRHCERALRNLPAEDPRLKMKGRFFFDPSKKLVKSDKLEVASNSILLRKGRTEFQWDEDANGIEHQEDQNQQLFNHNTGPRKITHQKICQTDEPTREDVCVQTETQTQTSDFSGQVYPMELEPIPKESRWEPSSMQQQQQQNYDDGPSRLPPQQQQQQQQQPQQQQQQQEPQLHQRGGIEDRFNNSRPLADRLDWSMRETFDHSSKLRDSDDLRWSLSKNASRDRQQSLNSWSRSFSPNRQTQQPIVSDHMHGNLGSGSSMPLSGMDNLLRGSGKDLLRERMLLDRGIMDRGMDMRDRDMDLRDRDIDLRDMDIRDRDMDLRNRDIDFRDRDMDSRNMESMWERDRGINNSRDIRGGGMMDIGTGGRGGLEEFGGRRDLDDYPMGARRELVDDYDMRAAGNSFGGANVFGRNLDRDPPPGRDSPPQIIDDDPEELEIIEERVFDREQPWKSRNATTNLNAFNNARGGAALSRGGIKRPFRGRIGNNVAFNNRMNF